MAKPDAPSILIVTAHFPPSPSIGGKRPHKIARVLADSGWDTTVLTLGESAKTEHHPSTAGKFAVFRETPFLPRQVVSRFQSGASPGAGSAGGESPRVGSARRLLAGLRRLASLGLARLQGIDEWAWWNRTMGNTLNREDFDLVLVTVPPFSISLGALELAERFSAKLILDYRDPWSDLPDKEHYRRIHGRDMSARFESMESSCLDAAELVFTVSPAIEGMLKRRRAGLRIKTVPQGYTGAIDSDQATEDFLLYAGSLAYGRSISEILRAVAELNRGQQKKVMLRYCGEHTALAREQAEAIGALDYLENLGSVGQSEVDALASRALASFVIVSPKYEYAYPGKLFDLVTSGRPILVISEKPCEAGTLVEEYELGQGFDKDSLGDLPGALAALRDSPGFSRGERVHELEDRVVLAQLESTLRELVAPKKP